MTKEPVKTEQCREKHFVYILLLSNGHYYCGYTGDIEKRMRKHLSGKGSKCVRSFRPVMIRRVWRIYGSKGDALRAESFVKSLTRDGKEDILEHPSQLGRILRRGIDFTVRVKEIRRYESYSVLNILEG
jgi:putative endonuclease